MPVSTGADTRMYSPRSESNLGYTKDPEDNPHGIGDPETMEQERDKRMLEQEHRQTISDLPHLQLDVPNPNPTPPPPPEMPEEPVMDDDNENARGAEVSQLTGMPDTGNLSIGNATGTMPQPGGMLATGEPMDDAWSSLLKAGIDILSEKIRDVDAEEAEGYPSYPHGYTSGSNAQIGPQSTFYNPRDSSKDIYAPLEAASINEAMESIGEMPEGKEVDQRWTGTFMGMSRYPEKTLDLFHTDPWWGGRWPNDKRPFLTYPPFNPEAVKPRVYLRDKPVQTGEPMDDAWSSLMKDESQDEFIAQQNEYQRRIEEAMANANRQMIAREESVPCPSCGAKIGESCIGLNPNLGYPSHKARMNLVQRSEPMDDAWSSLLKSYDEDHIQSFLDGDLDLHGMFDASFDSSRYPMLHINKHSIIDNLDEEDISTLAEPMGDLSQYDDALREYENNLKIMHDYVMFSRHPQGVPPQLEAAAQHSMNQTHNVVGFDLPPEAHLAINMQMYFANLEALKRSQVQGFMGQEETSLDSFQDKFTSEPMEGAWSELMKARKNLKNMGSSSVRPWKQPQYKIQPGGADISTATSRRSKLHSRHLQPHKHRGLDKAPLSVHRSHLGIETKQPLRLFPHKYGQQIGSMQRRKWQGNIPSGHPSGHAMGPETTYSPKPPKVASSAGLNIRSPTGPKLRGQNMGIKNTMKSEDIAGIKEDLTLLRKEMNYMHFAQMRRLMRKIKEALADKERRLKAAVSSGPGEKGEAGHMEGQDKTTRPTGATEDLSSDEILDTALPEAWGAPSTLFAAPGSGRVG